MQLKISKIIIKLSKVKRVELQKSQNENQAKVKVIIRI